MMGFAGTLSAQTTDPAYVEKLEKLYKNTVPILQPKGLETALKAEKKPILLDTRSPEEFAVSHIENARFIDFNRFNKSDVADLDRERPVVVYCTVGYRSERIGEKLEKLGFKTVYNLYGGIFEWVNQGHPVVDAQGNPTKKVHAFSEDWGKWLQKGEKIYR